MKDDDTITLLHQPGSIIDPLPEIAREGARQMLMAALKAEAASFVALFGEELLPDGRQRVVRHGAGPERTIQSGIGPIPIQRRKVRDRAIDAPPEQKIRFTSNVLPKWARRSRSLDALSGRRSTEVFPRTRHQRCWVHKFGNVLNHFPKSMQPAVTADLREISHAETRAAARAAIETFKEKYAAKYERGVVCLTKDTEALLTFYDFPAEHWDRLRTSNPIESVFATVRHRTVRTKGALSQKTAKLMVFTLVRAASKKWRQLSGANQLPRVLKDVKFNDGIAQSDANQSRAA